jgi:hypothetical protein
MEEKDLYGKNTITTFTGLSFSYLDMKPETICIEDIAHALSFIPRWLGHSPRFYSVAQHLCWCHDNIENKSFAYEALMHDATEAYIGDCPKPLKTLLSLVIAQKFFLPYPGSPEVKVIDKKALLWEYNNVKIPASSADIWTSQRAEQEFLDRFNKYYESGGGN